MVLGGSWVFLVVLGDSWWFLDVIGCSWWFLVVFVVIVVLCGGWGLLVII